MERHVKSNTVTSIVNNMSNKKYMFDNIVQRSYVWEPSRKSELICSLVEDYPINPVHAKEVKVTEKSKNGKDKTVTYFDFLDGKQRLNSIYDYVKGQYVLVGINPVEFNGELVDISGKYFSGLSEDMQNKIMNYEISVNSYEDMTDDESRKLFMRLNNGKSFTTKERNIANCVDIVNISEIGKHEFFQKAITEKSLKTRKQIPMIMKMYLMLTDSIDEISFASSDFNEVMQDTVISEETKAVINQILDRMLNVINILDESKAKAARKKFVAENNLMSLVPIFKKAIDEGISDNTIALFLTEVFTAKKTVSPKYKDACSAGSERNAYIKIRDNEINKAWNEFIDAHQNDFEDNEKTTEDSSETQEATSETQEATSEVKAEEVSTEDVKVDSEPENGAREENDYDDDDALPFD